ncbi:IclR family transcriptional regulator [Microbacterium sp. K24]|uniref:IclR family transcriptional regulator n=1 Tax=Microbacterium sp. K24 TaxID=2305446 RepID=UPI0014441FE2|nr:IclR family transcriptional regulator [Microbacterium sp. K24]
MTTVDKAFDVLDALLQADRPLGLSEVVARLDQPKPTVRRLLLSLIEQSLVLQNSESRYELGGLPVDLASEALSRASLADESNATIYALRQHVRGTITLSRYGDHGLTALVQVDASSPFLIAPTSQMPLYATASGKAILAFLPRADVARYVENGMTHVTTHTLEDPTSLAQELSTIRSRGYSVEDQEARLGVRAIAAPIRDFSHRPVGTLSIAAPAKVLSMPELVRMSSRIVTAADAISRRLGGVPLSSAKEIA